MYVHILDYMSTDSPTFLCLMYNVLYKRGEIILKKKLFIRRVTFYKL